MGRSLFYVTDITHEAMLIFFLQWFYDPFFWLVGAVSESKIPKTGDHVSGVYSSWPLVCFIRISITIPVRRLRLE
jgi:hypothetical protein